MVQESSLKSQNVKKILTAQKRAKVITVTEDPKNVSYPHATARPTVQMAKHVKTVLVSQAEQEQPKIQQVTAKEMAAQMQVHLKIQQPIQEAVAKVEKNLAKAKVNVLLEKNATMVAAKDHAQAMLSVGHLLPLAKRLTIAAQAR